MTINKQDVRRYVDMGTGQICPVNNMRESDDGNYVLYEDYKALQAENDRLRAKLAAMETELADLRAYKEAAESQKPLGIAKIIGGYPDESEFIVEWLVKHREISDGQPLYANPMQSDKPVTRQEVIDVLLSTRGQSEGVTADAILGLLRDKVTAPADKQAVEVPDCFVKLYEHARGMRFGTDWNNGTAARHNRKPLIDATLECESWLAAAPSHSQPISDVTIAGCDKKSITAEQYRTLVILARRAMHIAYVWNDHNFPPAHMAARETAKSLNIYDLDGANDFIANLPIQHLQDGPRHAHAHDSEQGGEA